MRLQQENLFFPLTHTYFFFGHGQKGLPSSKLVPTTNVCYNSLLWMCTLNPISNPVEHEGWMDEMDSIMAWKVKLYKQVNKSTVNSPPPPPILVCAQWHIKSERQLTYLPLKVTMTTRGLTVKVTGHVWRSSPHRGPVFETTDWKPVNRVLTQNTISK